MGLGKELPVAIGDRLLIRANCKPAKLKNGDVVEIRSFAPDGVIALADGRAIPAGFHQFSHGYATTSHASQGKTVARGILLMAEAGLQAANLKQAYVSNSRFKESQVIYTTDRRSASEAMKRSAVRRLASDVFSAAAAAAACFRQTFLQRLYNSGVANPAVAMMRGRMDVFADSAVKPAPTGFRQSA